MKKEVRDAIEILLSEIHEGDSEFVLEKTIEVGGEEAEKAIVLLANLSQA